MSVDWDIILFDTIRIKMCQGCKFESECHPPDDGQGLERDYNQICMCADENLKNTYRPEERYPAYG